MSNIQDPLTRLFKKQRIVFWYDADKELRSDFEAVELSGVNKIELANNEFAVKYRLLREEPDAKFLLYHEGSQPEDMDNWLLDVLLAHGAKAYGRTARTLPLESSVNAHTIEEERWFL